MEEPGGLLSIELHRVGHGWNGLACMHAYAYVYMTNNFVVELKHNIEANYISIKLFKTMQGPSEVLPQSWEVVHWVE